MNLSNKKIGIWGYGVSGKSLVNFLHEKDISLSILEKRQFNINEKKHLSELNVSIYYQTTQLDSFFNDNDFVIPSPGIDLNLYEKYNYKFISELDLFYSFFKKRITAITGTIGKTTITHLISEILKFSGKKIIAAGNIGSGVCDFINQQDNIDEIVLEISSYQLENCKIFKPNLSIWTNFYSNHLDRHGSLESYFDAKLKICSLQNENENALFPIEIAQKLNNKNLNCKKNFVSSNRPYSEQLKNIEVFNNIFFIENNFIYKMNSCYEIEQIVNLSLLPQITFEENWLIICSALYLQNIDLNLIKNSNLKLPEHRLNNFLSFNSIDFYDDSKSTIPESTLAAVAKLQGRPIILFLGGLSKGVDRSKLIFNLKNKVKFVICFGTEANNLKSLCDLNNIPSIEFSNLEDAVFYSFNLIKPNDQVLFSPSGSSFDLFCDYKDRGQKFQKLIRDVLG